MRLYHPAYAPVAWRDFWTFGCGALGDFGCHDLDSATWAFDLPAPESVEIRPAGYADAEIAPYGEIGYYQFAGAGSRPPLKLTWYSGGLTPPRPDALPERSVLLKRGVLFAGDKGIIQCSGAGGPPTIYPESLRTSYRPPKPTLPRSKGHHRDWLDAIKGGSPASANFEYAARLTEITLLGVLSLRLGGARIWWDAVNLKAKGLPEADGLVKEGYRKGWEIA
jgi:predicted dehydrogenase